MKISNNKYDLYYHNESQIERFYLNIRSISSGSFNNTICSLGKYFGLVQCNFRESFVTPDSRAIEKLNLNTDRAIKIFTDLSKYQIYMKVF